MRKKAFYILLFMAQICFLLLLLHFIDLTAIISTLTLADPLLILFVFFLEIFTLVVWTLRWKVLVDQLGNPCTLGNIFQAILIGSFFNNITPAVRSGGEPIRAYVLTRRYGIPFRSCFGTVLGERIIETIPFIVLIAIGFFLSAILVRPDIAASLLGILAFFVWVFVTIVYTISRESISTKFGLVLFRVIGDKRWIDQLKDFRLSTMLAWSDKKIFNLIVGFSTVYWSIELLKHYVIFRAIGFEVSIVYVIIAYIIIRTSGLVPVPGGLGVIEGASIGVYVLLGVPTAVAATQTIIYRFFSFWFISLIGMISTVQFGFQEIFERWVEE